jgi:hypothetical protein
MTATRRIPRLLGVMFLILTASGAMSQQPRFRIPFYVTDSSAQMRTLAI